MKIGKRRKKRGFLPVFLLILVLFIGAVSLRLLLLWNSPAEEPGREVTVEIPTGSSFVAAARILHREGVIRSVEPFVFLGKIKGLSGSIQAGELMFRTDMTPLEALETLAEGRPVQYPVTLPEGFTVRQIARLLETKGLAHHDDCPRDCASIFARG